VSHNEKFGYMTLTTRMSVSTECFYTQAWRFRHSDIISTN